MKILPIEDDNRIADALVEELTDRHHVVELATDGELGLELALASPHDLILLDIMLPKLDGLQVCRQLRDAYRSRRGRRPRQGSGRGSR
jgi:DNA-binding response OmpR family regulator